MKHLHNSTIEQVVAQKIGQSAGRRITFAEFMSLALYHPELGYYTTRESVLGPQGDFVTSPHMGHDFGELMAEQFADMWMALGKPEPFTVMEMGAGQGLVASDAIAHLQTHYPDCFTALRYIIVEKSAALRVEQKKRLSHWNQQGLSSLSWQSLDEVTDESIVGCAFSNELVDAFPVHWVEWHSSQLKEVWVTYLADQFEPVLAELSDPALAEYFPFVEVNLSAGYPEGYRTEVNLAAGEWMAQVARKLKRGYVLTVDYGYSAQQYYSPARREGTLQCYWQHRHHSDPFIHVGEQDITAHVDFTALEKWGEQAGLSTLEFTQQGLFLMALGLSDRLGQLAQTGIQRPATPQEIQSTLMRRDALQQLINPMGLGKFGVLVQAKGLSQTEIARPLKGLAIPSMPSFA